MSAAGGKAAAAARPAAALAEPARAGGPAAVTGGKEVPKVLVDPRTRRSFVRGRFLGKGGFARCYELAEAESREVFAGKVVPKSLLVKPHQKEKMSMEIAIHRSLAHRHVVGFHGFFEDADFVYVVLELCRRRVRGRGGGTRRGWGWEGVVVGRPPVLTVPRCSPSPAVAAGAAQAAEGAERARGAVLPAPDHPGLPVPAQPPRHTPRPQAGQPLPQRRHGGQDR